MHPIPLKIYAHDFVHTLLYIHVYMHTRRIYTHKKTFTDEMSSRKINRQKLEFNKIKTTDQNNFYDKRKQSKLGNQIIWT